MLQHIVNNSYCNFIGITLYECNIPIRDCESFVKVGTSLYNITTSTRLQLSHNNEGLIAFVRSSLNTNTWVDDIAYMIPHHILYSAISDNILPESIRVHANTTMDSGSIYDRVIAYTLYPYADTITKETIACYLKCIPINIGKKPTLIEQLNAIPLEHKLPWFRTAVDIGHNDLSSLFDGYKFPYELAVVVLETLAVEFDGTRRGEALKIMRESLDTCDILSLLTESNLYTMQILIDAVDRNVISIDDIVSRTTRITTNLCEVLEEYNNGPLFCMGVHKLVALVLSTNSNYMLELENKLLHNFVPDNCKFCARIKYE